MEVSPPRQKRQQRRRSEMVDTITMTTHGLGMGIDRSRQGSSKPVMPSPPCKRRRFLSPSSASTRIGCHHFRKDDLIRRSPPASLIIPDLMDVPSVDHGDEVWGGTGKDNQKNEDNNAPSFALKPRFDGQALGCVSRLVGVCKSQFKVIPSKPSMAAQQRAALTARRAVPHRVNGHRHSSESLPVSLPKPVPIQAPMQAPPSTTMGPFNSLGPRVVCPPQHDGCNKHRNYHGHHERQQQQQHRVEGLQPLMLQHYSSSGCSNNGNNLGRTGMVMHQCGPGGLTRYQTPPHRRSLMRVDPHHSGVFTSLPARFVSPSCEQASDNDSNSIDGRESLPPSHESAMPRPDLP